MKLLKIGRDASCNIVLHSAKVSSLHAELTLLNSGDMVLEDKGSTNGTYIMNQRIQPGKPVNVKRGDAIRFADVELQWSQVPMPEDNSAYRGIYGIGTHFNNEIQISGATVSRYHATVKHGKDGKMYIFDHSKNGTTVNGTKIPSNNPVQIKKSSAVVCGGVPVNLSHLPWPDNAWKKITCIAAVIALVVGIAIKLFPYIGFVDPEKEIYERYHNSIVMLKTIYYYEVSIGDIDIQEFNLKVGRQNGIKLKHKFLASYNNLWDILNLTDISSYTDKELIDKIDEITDNEGMGTATGFFISKDGKIVTNLHVVKPWLSNDLHKKIENKYKKEFAEVVTQLTNDDPQKYSYLNAYISQVKVKGVTKYVALIPNGEVFDPDNMIKCNILYDEGENLDKDVALLKIIDKALPDKFNYINIEECMDIREDNYSVGSIMHTFGFPKGTQAQDKTSTDGIEAFLHSGKITKKSEQYKFVFDAVSAPGASGSPVFNDKANLIGVLNSGFTDKNITYGIKAKYVKEMLDKYNAK